MAVPVTTGANRLRRRLNTGAMSRPSKPETMVAPNTPGRPRAGLEAMAMAGPTETKVTPIITGSRTPMGPTPRHWTRVTRPQAIRSELTR